LNFLSFFLVGAVLFRACAGSQDFRNDALTSGLGLMLKDRGPGTTGTWAAELKGNSNDGFG
jgi:hypothetical protein